MSTTSKPSTTLRRTSMLELCRYMILMVSLSKRINPCNKKREFLSTLSPLKFCILNTTKAKMMNPQRSYLESVRS